MLSMYLNDSRYTKQFNALIVLNEKYQKYHMVRVMPRLLLPFLQHGDCQEIAIQHKQTLAKTDSCLEAVMQHLYHMGNRFIPLPGLRTTFPKIRKRGHWKKLFEAIDRKWHPTPANYLIMPYLSSNSHN